MMGEGDVPKVVLVGVVLFLVEAEDEVGSSSSSSSSFVFSVTAEGGPWEDDDKWRRS